MKVAIASDHAGFRLKEEVKQLLRELGHEVRDFGAHSEEPVDYPDFVVQAAEAVRRAECLRAIVFGGSGNGEAMVANKVPGIRCALCHDVTTARLARAHNDANVLALGQRITGSEVAKDIVHTWLDTPFEGGRHQRRVDKIAAVEAKVAGRAAPARGGTHKTRRGG
ncbi:MAG TPA: ribose 5-phosphate isomerase B [bacterium]|nr:ribose 5-phosphate isomerase B [bacterium]